LNYLAGRQKAIVTNVKGTTRDWISATCRIEPLSIEFFDTAGLDEKLSAHSDTIEKAAQQKSIEILEQADLVLLILDNNQPAEQLDEGLREKIADKRVLTVLNKSDLPPRFDIVKLPENLSKTVLISAKFGTGIEALIEKILQICGVSDFDLKTVVYFTERQKNLLKQLQNTRSRQQAASIITDLLNGWIKPL
jgi:tRNA modification GTPase